MSFTKAPEPSSIPFGIYRFDHDYVRALKKADNNVIDPEENDCYCGPVYSAISERGVSAFFVPVDIATYDEYNVLPMFLYLGKLGGDFLDFTKMIPLMSESLASYDDSRKDIINYVTKIRERIEECADYIISLQQGTIDPKTTNINERYSIGKTDSYR